MELNCSQDFPRCFCCKTADFPEFRKTNGNFLHHHFQTLEYPLMRYEETNQHYLGLISRWRPKTSKVKKEDIPSARKRVPLREARKIAALITKFHEEHMLEEQVAAFQLQYYST